MKKKKKKYIYFRYSWIIHKYSPSDKYYFYSYSHFSEITNYSYSYSYRSWLCESIPIPICGKNNYLLITVLLVRFMFPKTKMSVLANQSIVYSDEVSKGRVGCCGCWRCCGCLCSCVCFFRFLLWLWRWVSLALVVLSAPQASTTDALGPNLEQHTQIT